MRLGARGPAGEDAGQGVGRIAAGMDLKGLAPLRGIIVVKPVEHPEVGETLEALQGRCIFRIDFQPGTLTLLFHHADGIQTDGFDGSLLEVWRRLARGFRIDRDRPSKTPITPPINHPRMVAHVTYR